MADIARTRKSVSVKYRAHGLSTLEIQYIQHYRAEILRLQTRIDELAIENLSHHHQDINTSAQIQARIVQKLQILEHKDFIPRVQVNLDSGKKLIANWSPAAAYTSFRFEHRHLEYLLLALNVPNEIMISQKNGRLRGETMLLMTLYHFAWPSRLTDMEEVFQVPYTAMCRMFIFIIIVYAMIAWISMTNSIFLSTPMKISRSVCADADPDATEPNNVNDSNIEAFEAGSGSKFLVISTFLRSRVVLTFASAVVTTEDCSSNGRSCDASL